MQSFALSGLWRSRCPYSRYALFSVTLVGCSGGPPELASGVRGAKLEGVSLTAQLDPEPNDRASVQLNGDDIPGARLGRYRMHWPVRSPSEVAARVSSVAGMFGISPASLRAERVPTDGVGTPFAGREKVRVIYRAAYDDLEVTDSSVHELEQPASDIGEESARHLALAKYSELVKTGVIDGRNYDFSDVGTGHRRRTVYRGDKSQPVDFVVEYRFRALRKLNGIDVANNWIVIGISPEAYLSTVRVAGVAIESTRVNSLEKPSASGDIATRTVSTADAMKRFQEEMRQSGRTHHIHWAKKMYYMPAGVRDAVVEPLLVVQFNQSASAQGGSTIPGWAQATGVSLTNPTATLSQL